MTFISLFSIRLEIKTIHARSIIAYPRVSLCFLHLLLVAIYFDGKDIHVSKRWALVKWTTRKRERVSRPASQSRHRQKMRDENAPSSPNMNKVHPKDKANIISRVLLWWIVDLLRRGSKTPLNQEDLDPVREDDCAARHTKRLDEIWQNERNSARQQRKKPKLWKAMIKYFTWQEHALVNFLMLFNVFGNAVFFFSVTNLMKAIGSNFEGGTHSPDEYLIFILGMMVGSFCEVLGSQHSCLYLPVLGIRARAALVGLIYKKVRHIIAESTSIVMN